MGWMDGMDGWMAWHGGCLASFVGMSSVVVLTAYDCLQF